MWAAELGRMPGRFSESRPRVKRPHTSTPNAPTVLSGRETTSITAAYRARHRHADSQGHSCTRSSARSAGRTTNTWSAESSNTKCGPATAASPHTASRTADPFGFRNETISTRASDRTSEATWFWPIRCRLTSPRSSPLASTHADGSEQGAKAGDPAESQSANQAVPWHCAAVKAARTWATDGRDSFLGGCSGTPRENLAPAAHSSTPSLADRCNGIACNDQPTTAFSSVIRCSATCATDRIDLPFLPPSALKINLRACRRSCFGGKT